MPISELFANHCKPKYPLQSMKIQLPGFCVLPLFSVPFLFLRRCLQSFILFCSIWASVELLWALTCAEAQSTVVTTRLPSRLLSHRLYRLVRSSSPAPTNFPNLLLACLSIRCSTTSFLLELLRTVCPNSNFYLTLLSTKTPVLFWTMLAILSVWAKMCRTRDDTTWHHSCDLPCATSQEPGLRFCRNSLPMCWACNNECDNLNSWAQVPSRKVCLEPLWHKNVFFCSRVVGSIVGAILARRT